MTMSCTGMAGEPGGFDEGVRAGAEGPGAGSAGPSGSAAEGLERGPGDSDPKQGSDSLVEVEPPSPTLRRLTPEQYRNSVLDLTGIAPDVSALTAVPPLNGLQAIGASTIAVAEVDVERFEGLADDVSERLFADGAARSALLGCDALQVDCAEGFVTVFGRRAFRRPLSSEEQDRYLMLLRTATSMTGDGWLALRVFTSAVLQSPSFLYRAELGEPDPADANRRILTDYELASRLSYFLWNTTPDDALLDAAEGGLGDATLRTQVQRLLASDRSVPAMEALFSDYLQLGSMADLVKLPEVYPQMSDTLGASMARETLLTLRTLVYEEDMDFRDVFTTTTTFLNPELARLYDVPEPASGDFERTALPADGSRAGLLGHATFLAGHSHAGRTSPTKRGKFIRESLLCQGIPPPPAGVDTTLPDTSSAKTMREKLTIHRQDPSCAGCHSLMDPPGLGLEHFDGIGAYRLTDNGETIDASGELDGLAFQDGRQLGEALAQNPDTASCFIRTVLRFARGHLEHHTEEAWVQALSEDFASQGYRMSALLTALIAHPSFRHVGELQ